MGIKFKKITLCIWLLFFSVYLTAAPAAIAAPPVGTEAAAAADKCTDYLRHYCQAEPFDCFTSWTPIALRAVERDCMNSIWPGETAVTELEQDIKTKLTSDLDVTTSLARYIIILQAAGKDPANFTGQNLISRLEKTQLPSGKFPDSINSGGEELVNAHIWSMIALSATEASQWDREKAICWLKEQQHPDGGFNFMTGDTDDADVDVTSTAIIALALNGAETEPVLTRAVDYLRNAQLPGGGFASWQTENLESAAMVMQALVAAGIDPDRAPWSRDSQNLIDIIMSYQLKDGSFAHVKGGKGNLMSSEQALMALGDYIQGESVYKRLASSPDTAFKDLKSTDPAYAAIMKLGEQGVMIGYPDKSFRPASGISRAEFAQVLAMAHGGTWQAFSGNKDFLDVNDSHWARKAIAYCARRGWMQGMDSAHFAPDQQLTGAELLTVIVRVMGLPINERQAGAAWYQPYVDASTDKGLIYPGFKAESNATRGQCAIMIDKVLK